MLYRTATEQTTHDSIIEGLAEIYIRNDFRVWTNPNQQKNKDFSGVYPDVIVKLQDDDSYWIFEVETDASINDNEAEQWKDYGQRFKFLLTVPVKTKATAEEIVTRKQVKNVFFITYKQNPNGTISFTGLPGEII